jgi:hypothetical protein
MITLNLDGQKFDHVSNGALANNHLTIKPLVGNLSALLPSLVAVRGESRKKHKMPIKARLIIDCVIKCNKFMVGVIWGASARRILVSCLSTQIIPTARFLRESSGVPSNSQGTHHAAE